MDDGGLCGCEIGGGGDDHAPTIQNVGRWWRYWLFATEKRVRVAGSRKIGPILS